MTSATPEQLAMAVRIAEKVGRRLHVNDANRLYDIEQSALAAIIETQRLDAELADSMTLEMPGISIGLADGASLARRQIATAIRAGKHYGKDEG